ncbi:Allantoicase [Actinomortierella ambigua]|nr:Allantoicase [Actinomortierella ambigua]
MTAPAFTPIEPAQFEAAFKGFIDLAVVTRGGKILTRSDEWFADCHNLLTATPPVSKPGTFTANGAWYDGWETRRHNPTFDWCVIQLGYAGTIAGFEVDTTNFTGNHAPFVSVEGFTETAGKAVSRTQEEWAKVEWTPILSKIALNPHARQGFKLETPTKSHYTHLRFCMYPDGGVARLRAYGTVQKVVPANKQEKYDLAAISSGSTIDGFSDAHYGHPSNMLLPGRGVNMGDGWETKRSRSPGHVDWTVIKLGSEGHVTDIEIDTAHYMGNPPKEVSIIGFEAETGKEIVLLNQAPVKPHLQHFYKVAEELTQKKISSAKVVMIPDGGIKRVRLWGAAQLPAVEPANSIIGVRNPLPDEDTWDTNNDKTIIP